MTHRNYSLAIWLLAACVVIQGFGMAVWRATGSSHYHTTTLSAPAAHHAAHGEGGDGHHHSHATVEHHHHDADDASVISAEPDDAANSGGVVPKRPVADLGIVAWVPAGPTATACDAAWDAHVPCAFASHVTAPPERPPRLRG